MKSALPLLAVGGAALLLMGGKKKKKPSAAPTDQEEDSGDAAMEADEQEADEGGGPATQTASEYGPVAAGVRRDRLGSHAWQIDYQADGYHANLMSASGKFASVVDEVGVAASLRAAKEMLRDHFNEAILAAGWSEDDFLEDPVEPRAIVGRIQVMNA